MKIDNIVIELLGQDSYKKGKKYYKSYIELIEEVELEKGKSAYQFVVESERYYTDYDVIVIVNNNRIIGYRCDCFQFNNNHTCKHLAAVMLNYADTILKKTADPYVISESILNNFYEGKKKNNKTKEELTLKLELCFSNPVTFKLHIGLNKTYILNNETKFNNFFDAYDNQKEYCFGLNFTYNPSVHYFSDADLELIDYLRSYKKIDTYYYKSNIFELNDRELSSLLDKLQGKNFLIKNYGLIKDIKKAMPTTLNLDLNADTYHLNINNLDDYKVLDDEYKYVVYNHILYIIPKEYSIILRTFLDNELSELLFKKNKVDLFKNGLLKKVKDNIDISENVKDIVIASKPSASLYFDLTRDKIKCQVKLDYKGRELDYFDNDDVLMRDEEYEQTVISKLLNLNFKIDKKKIILDDVDNIGTFLSEGIDELSKEYKVYTSKKIDNIGIIKKSNITSNFSIGKDGIMSYSFDTDNIKLDELNDILISLKSNKRYYKLKSGDLIDLDNNNELRELNNIFNDLELSGKDVLNGEVEIPKYRAFYIDSLKKEKYGSICTDNSFDKFINNFKKYKDIEVKLDKSDDKILRDYQKEGVKWLYTLYKCDLGGILADEMGLGKSLQTIMFIKLILKEKKDAKIMIVCPTALVYNWKREFEKFAPDLKYITVADNKQKRKEIINNIDDYNIFITSYGLVRNDNDEYEKVDFEVCIIDEAQAIKNYQANMTHEIKKIKARTKIALTGTPIENSVLELWSIFDFIMPGYLNSITKFRENYGISDVDEASLARLKNLNYQIQPFILRRKKDEVTKDLPDKLENNIYLELPDMQKALYVKVLKESKEEMDELIAKEGFKKTRFKILQLLMKLRQICVDPNILYSNYKGESVKFEKLIEVVKDYIKDGHKILIFSSFKRVVDRVKTLFDKENITSFIIAGDVNSKTRMELVDKFNSDDTNCFLITLKSGGTGLNLTSADIVIHLDIWWNPQVENQATDRAHRIGQKKTVSVIKLITKGTIEERIIELQDKKKILSDNLIEGKNNSSTLSSLSEKDIKDLLACGDDD